MTSSAVTTEALSAIWDVLTVEQRKAWTDNILANLDSIPDEDAATFADFFATKL